MRRCELCKAKARMHCPSDQASLCWDCDAAVHSANFLVARHSRNLLCDVCQSPTPWTVSGGKLRSTAPICEHCTAEPCDDNRDHEEEEEPFDSSDDESDDEEEETVEDNQVVPWSPPPPAEESSSSADESIGGGNVVSRKRLRIEEDESLNIRLPAPETAPSRVVQIMVSGRVDLCGSEIVLDALRRLHEEDMGSGQEMEELCDSSGPSI